MFTIVPPSNRNLQSPQGINGYCHDFLVWNKKDSQKIASQSQPPNKVHATSASVLLDREVPPLDPPPPHAPPLSDPCLQFKQAGMTLLEKLKVQHPLAIISRTEIGLKLLNRDNFG